jgi:pyruvate dehydrogenase E1 component alpha subunit
VPEAVRARIDAEIEALLDEAERFVYASAEPDPAGALDYLYANGLRGRAGTA